MTASKTAHICSGLQRVWSIHYILNQWQYEPNSMPAICVCLCLCATLWSDTNSNNLRLTLMRGFYCEIWQITQPDYELNQHLVGCVSKLAHLRDPVLIVIISNITILQNPFTLALILMLKDYKDCGRTEQSDKCRCFCTAECRGSKNDLMSLKPDFSKCKHGRLWTVLKFNLCSFSVVKIKQSLLHSFIR